MREVWVETEYRGFEISGHVIIGDTTGDGSVPGGISVMEPYCNDLSISINGKDDISDMLTADACVDCEEALIEVALEDYRERENHNPAL